MIKKAMDIFDIVVLTNIYRNKLVNCYVDNVYYANYYWFLKINCRGDKFFIKIEPGVRLHLSRVEPSVKSIDKLTAFMRKYLRESRLVDFRKINWERVVCIELTKQGLNYSIVAEIVPRGLLAILDSRSKIMYANQFIKMRDRVIEKGVYYKPPPLFSTPPYSDENELLNKLSIGADLVRGVVKGWGLPGYVAEEIIYRSNLYEYKNRSISEISKSDLEKLIEAYRELVRETNIVQKGYLILQNENTYLYTLYKPLVYIDIYELVVKEYVDLNELIDYYFTQYEREKIIEQEKSKLESSISQLEKTIEKQRNTINEYEAKEREYRKIYETLLNNYSIVENTLDCVKTTREEKDWSSVLNECRGVYSIDKNHGLIYIVIGEYTIPLDIRLDTWKNILKYSIEASKYRSLAERARLYMDDLSRKLAELRNQTIALTQSLIKSIRPRYWFEKYHWIITTNGLLAIGGRNSDQNESIVKKHLSHRDLFIHADIQGAPVTVLKTRNESFMDEDIHEAGLITTCYSRGWKIGFGYLDAYWVYGEQVSKKAPSGEYLSKGSFMVYGKRNYFKVELKLGIGIEDVCDSVYGIYQRVVINKPENIGNKTLVYATLAPGDRDVGEIASEIYSSFAEKLGVDKLSISLDELIYRIPGRSRILSISKGFQKPITEC